VCPFITEKHMHQKHRRPGELSPGDVRQIIVRRMRVTSRAVLCERFNVSRKLREVGHSTKRAVGQ
jgi:hypothetical protein